MQSSLNAMEQGTVEIAPQFVDGLAGLKAFDYIWLLSWLHAPDQPADHPAKGPPEMTQVPFLLSRSRRRMGIFATRGPRRVNLIGLSLVRLIGISGATIRFAGVDLLDGTPVLDIKPYVTRFDRPPGQPRCGWFDSVTMPEGATPASLGNAAD